MMSEIPDESYTIKDIGKRITKLRKSKGMSVYQLQMKADVNRTIIKDTEEGRNRVRIDTLLKIIDGLAVSPAEFFGEFK